MKDYGKFRMRKAESDINMDHTTAVFQLTLPIELLVTPGS